MEKLGKYLLISGLLALFMFLESHAISPVARPIRIIKIALAVVLSAAIIELAWAVLETQLSSDYKTTLYLVSALTFHHGMNTRFLPELSPAASALASVFVANAFMMTGFLGCHSFYQIYAQWRGVKHKHKDFIYRILAYLFMLVFFALALMTQDLKAYIIWIVIFVPLGLYCAAKAQKHSKRYGQTSLDIYTYKTRKDFMGGRKT